MAAHNPLAPSREGYSRCWRCLAKDYQEVALRLTRRRVGAGKMSLARMKVSEVRLCPTCQAEFAEAYENFIKVFLKEGDEDGTANPGRGNDDAGRVTAPSLHSPSPEEDPQTQA